MTTEESFGSLVNRLTETHKVTVERDDGTTDYPETDGLLQRLREAITSGMTGGAGGSSFGSKPPLEATAADLYADIDRQAAEALAAVTGRPTGLAHAEENIQDWYQRVTEDKRVVVTSRTTDINGKVYSQYEEHTAASLVARWVQRVEEYFVPPRVKEINAPCPDCGVRYIQRKKDGEDIHVAAFNIHYKADNATVDEARCSACGATWWPGSFIDVLAPLLGAKPLPELKG
ncbi:DUF7341 domain-containing protein [Plantibacter sp. YIM 135249]|uniref:DUF7341 domain-containing protein n=1 Tax=Plantibacter sp. YIM 135249 TaxID=3423918 RepID=UPI003D3283A5